jgi:hypothetical protein
MSFNKGDAMAESKHDFRPALENLARTVGVLLKTTYDGLNMLERNVFEILDKQMTNRLLSQYDKLIGANFNHKEALDAVTNMVKRRLETAVQERKQNFE